MILDLQYLFRHLEYVLYSLKLSQSFELLLTSKGHSLAQSEDQDERLS
jgi:hypothetical protein